MGVDFGEFFRTELIGEAGQQPGFVKGYPGCAQKRLAVDGFLQIREKQIGLLFKHERFQNAVDMHAAVFFNRQFGMRRIYFCNFWQMASPISRVPTNVMPSLIISAVRRPSSSTSLTACSIASASSAMSKE